MILLCSTSIPLLVTLESDLQHAVSEYLNCSPYPQFSSLTTVSFREHTNDSQNKSLFNSQRLVHSSQTDKTINGTPVLTNITLTATNEEDFENIFPLFRKKTRNRSKHLLKKNRHFLYPLRPEESIEGNSPAMRFRLPHLPSPSPTTNVNLSHSQQSPLYSPEADEAAHKPLYGTNSPDWINPVYYYNQSQFMTPDIKEPE